MKSSSSSTSSDFSSKIQCQSISSAAVNSGLACLPNKDEDRYCIYSPSSDNDNITSSDGSYFGFGVFDGHGGMFGSELCSRLLCKEVIEDVLSKQSNLNKLKRIVNTEQDDDYNDIIDAFYCESIKNVTKSLSREIKQISKTGTTSCTLFLKKLSDGSYRAYCGNTGDSRCVVYYKRGTDSRSGGNCNATATALMSTRSTKENIGNTTAMMSSAWMVVAMSDDHKLDSEEEIRRIENDLPTPWYPLPANIGAAYTSGKEVKGGDDDFGNQGISSSSFLKSKIDEIDYDYETSLWQYPSVEKMARIQLLRNNLDAYFQSQQAEEEAIVHKRQQTMGNMTASLYEHGDSMDADTDTLTFVKIPRSKVSSDSAISMDDATAITSLDSFKSLDLPTKLSLLTSLSQSNLATLDSFATASVAIAAIGGSDEASSVTREVNVVDETARCNNVFVLPPSFLSHTEMTTACNNSRDGDVDLFTESTMTIKRTTKKVSYMQRIVSTVSNFIFNRSSESTSVSLSRRGIDTDGSMVEFDDTVHGHDQLAAAAARKQTLTLAFEPPPSGVMTSTPRSLTTEQLLMDLSLHSVASRGSVLSVYEPEYDTPTDDNEFITAPLFHRKSFIARRQARDGSYSTKCALFSRHNISITMTRSIGDRHAARSCVCTPDVSAITIQPHQYARFIIGSDGFWDVYSNQQAMEMVLELTDTSEASSLLVCAARRMRENLRIRIDDITCLVVDINPSLHPVLVFEAAAAAASTAQANNSKNKMNMGMHHITRLCNDMFFSGGDRTNATNKVTNKMNIKNTKKLKDTAVTADKQNDDYDLDSRT